MCKYERWIENVWQPEVDDLEDDYEIAEHFGLDVLVFETDGFSDPEELVMLTPSNAEERNGEIRIYKKPHNSVLPHEFSEELIR